MNLRTTSKTLLLTFSFFTYITTWAHDPIFGFGPHVLFKGGVEVATEVHLDKTGAEKETEFGLELKYGITGDWAIGIEMPYLRKNDGLNVSSGSGDVKLFTKFRFWRNDSLGVQESAAVLLKVKLDNADSNSNPALGPGATDTILGLTYGYEARKWYRWASIRYRRNGKNNAGFHRGDKILFDLAGGLRPKMNAYTEPDTVWLLELNGEIGQRNRLNGNKLANSGGNQWFISPGIFWTKRNFAIKAGIQIPISSSLNGSQDDTDYRAKITFEWHL